MVLLRTSYMYGDFLEYYFRTRNLLNHQGQTDQVLSALTAIGTGTHKSNATFI